jgi:excisionase family DNA binding protein
MRTNKNLSTSNIEPLLLTVEEAALKLRCGRSTVYVLMDRGDISSVKIGHLRRIRPDALVSYIERAAIAS